jgi:hypothetical protein
MTIHHSKQNQELLKKASTELEILRLHGSITVKHSNNSSNNKDGKPFPNSCLNVLRSIPGNSRCIDCGNCHPDWASVSYGILLCVRCSGRHRSYGVATSRVRSVSMDNWSYSQVLSMLEGGNEQLHNFYSRHLMCDNKSKVFDRRYQTKAARFYRINMEVHVANVGKFGQWKGRESSRKAVILHHCDDKRKESNNSHNAKVVMIVSAA